MVPHKAGKANEGHSCVKGRFAYGYATHKDRILKPMIRERIEDPWREVSWDEAIAYAASEFKRIQAQYGRDFGRRDQLLALHQRRSVPGSEDGARRIRQQQCRHLRARLPLADRLWPFQDLRHFGRHAGFQVGREVGRRRRDRGESDRRPSGVRLSPQEASARRRPPHRHRPAPHRSGQEPARRGRLSSGAEARNQRRGPERDGACRRHRGPGRRGLRARALRPRQFRVLGALRRRSRAIRRRRRPRPPASIRASCARPRGSMRPAAMGRSITASASPSTARARRR